MRPRADRGTSDEPIGVYERAEAISGSGTELADRFRSGRNDA